MAAYLIADIDVRDAERYKEYVEHVPALIRKHRGEYRVRGGACRVLEGRWQPSRLVVLEFPTREDAVAFYDDPEYAPYRNLRLSIADSSLMIVDGCE